MGLGICGTGVHRHAQPRTGGRCAFWSPGKPDGICGRAPVAVYVNPAATPRHQFRCSAHDRDVARGEAARQGWSRQEVGR